MRPPFRLFAAAVLTAIIPLTAAAQEGGYPVKPNPTTQYVYQNGEVVQRLGEKTTRLTRNLRLPDGTKINYKSGMVEMAGGKMAGNSSAAGQVSRSREVQGREWQRGLHAPIY